MGDRGNIAIIQSNNDQVWLYSHWGGSELPERLKAGLTAGKGRWTDESYLAKIIIGHAVPADNWTEETGYGISCRLQDIEHDIMVVNIPQQRLHRITEASLKNYKVPPNFAPDPKQSWTFQEFCDLPELPPEE